MSSKDLKQVVKSINYLKQQIQSEEHKHRELQSSHE